MRVIGVIPSRWGSTRFPGKSLHPICGKPLVQWVVEAARRASALDDIMVATDDVRIADAVSGFVKVAMTRADHPSGTDRVAEAAQPDDDDIVINIADRSGVDRCAGRAHEGGCRLGYGDRRVSDPFDARSRSAYGGQGGVGA